ncbi:hypothetical protein CEE45_14445 [Candidatus Heimdallarchaeota archaeon B3_Heim]|nr:MAG: hypothetical protein CEE45_14445 [Candidatus Heimdallarchaeota archaeon B3_Heim]
MIDVHIYGFLKKKFDPNASLGDDLIIKLKHRDGLLLQELFEDLKLSQEECGDCFIDGKVVKRDQNPVIKEHSRVAIFSEGMYLLCGGQHLKGHGFITRSAPKDYDYFHLSNR